MASGHFLFRWYAVRHERLGGAVEWCPALLAVSVGVLGLFPQAEMARMIARGIDLHALFGLLLMSFSVARFCARLQRPGCFDRAAIREFSRQLSRSLYLVIYGVVGVRLAIGLAESIAHPTALHFALSDTDQDGFNPTADLRWFVAYALAVLVASRVAAYVLWRRAAQ